VDRDALVALNIVHEAGYAKSHWRERVLFPFSWEGRQTCFSGRVLGEPEDGVPKFLTTRTYAPGPGGGEMRWFKGVYNAAALIGASRITLVEGAIDACALVELALPDLPRPIALSGKELSAPVRRWLQGKPRLQVVLALDRDEAGREAAAEWTRELGEHRVSTCHPPAPHKDWADMCSAFANAFPPAPSPLQPPGPTFGG
jgi:DNA primase